MAAPDLKRIAQSLRALAVELDPPTAVAERLAEQPGSAYPPIMPPAPTPSSDPWERAGMHFDTMEARIIAASKFDQYIAHPTDWRLNHTVPLESPEWLGVTLAKYGTQENYISVAMANLNVSREALGRWMRAVFEHRGYPVPGWWAQWFATSPA